MEAGKIKASTLLISVGVIVAVETAAKIGGGGLFHPVIVLGAARLIEAMLFLGIIAGSGQGLDAVGLGFGQILTGIGKGLLWSGAFGALAGLVLGAAYLVGADPAALLHFEMPAETSGRVYLLVVAGLAAPITEEIFFRGVLYGFLRRWGVAAAVSLSTLFFVLPHITGTTLPTTQIVGGVVFAAAYEKEGKLTTPITIHVLGNLSIMTLSAIG